jgi:hypothetical protein
MIKMSNKQTKKALNGFKNETASELGISNYDKLDKGNLTARQNGTVGGQMVKKMIQTYENEHF